MRQQLDVMLIERVIAACAVDLKSCYLDIRMLFGFGGADPRYGRWFYPCVFVCVCVCVCVLSWVVVRARYAAEFVVRCRHRAT